MKGGTAEKEETVCMAGNRINHKPPSKKNPKYNYSDEAVAGVKVGRHL